MSTNHFIVTISPNNQVWILDSENTMVENLIRNTDSDETYDEFNARVNHRLNWRNSGKPTEMF